MRNNFPFSLLSHGRAWVGARIVTSDVRYDVVAVVVASVVNVVVVATVDVVVVVV